MPSIEEDHLEIPELSPEWFKLAVQPNWQVFRGQRERRRASLPTWRTEKCATEAIDEPRPVAMAPKEGYVWLAMQPLKAHVHKGRLLLDEPTDLPEGEVVELVSIDEALARGGDDLDDEDRTALHRELDASVVEADAGNTIDADAVLAELRATR